MKVFKLTSLYHKHLCLCTLLKPPLSSIHLSLSLFVCVTMCYGCERFYMPRVYCAFCGVGYHNDFRLGMCLTTKFSVCKSYMFSAHKGFCGGNCTSVERHFTKYTAVPCQCGRCLCGTPGHVPGSSRGVVRQSPVRYWGGSFVGSDLSDRGGMATTRMSERSSSTGDWDQYTQGGVLAFARSFFRTVANCMTIIALGCR